MHFRTKMYADNDSNTKVNVSFFSKAQFSERRLQYSAFFFSFQLVILSTTLREGSNHSICLSTSHTFKRDNSLKIGSQCFRKCKKKRFKSLNHAGRRKHTLFGA